MIKTIIIVLIGIATGLTFLSFNVRESFAYSCKQTYWCEDCVPPGNRERETCCDHGSCPAGYEGSCNDINECGSCGSQAPCGNNPVNTPTPLPSATPSVTPSITPSVTPPTSTNTPTPTNTPVPVATNTPTPTPGFCVQGASIVLPAGPTPSNTPIPTPTAGPQMGLFKFKVKLQGVEWANIANEAYKTQKVKVMFQVIKKTTDTDGNTVYQTTLSKTFSDVTITAKAPAGGTISVWEGQFTPTGVSIGNNYVVFIKGFKHLQRKFCQNNPTERAEEGFPYRCLGEGQISLVAGENSFDFSNVLLQAGDLPVQDGVVNAYDVSVILNILKNGESRNAAHLAAADIDLNGVVNAKDRSYLIETLEEKYGDEE